MFQLEVNEFGVSLAAWSAEGSAAIATAIATGALPAGRVQTYRQNGRQIGASLHLPATKDNVKAVKGWLAARPPEPAPAGAE